MAAERERVPAGLRHMAHTAGNRDADCLWCLYTPDSKSGAAAGDGEKALGAGSPVVGPLLAKAGIQ